MKSFAVQNRIKPEIPSSCREFQKLNAGFIAGKLPFETSYAYTKHLRNCEECMEELKAYYMFYTAVRYLNEKDESEMPQNVGHILEDIENEAVFLRKRRRNIFISLIAFLSGVIILGILLLNGNIF